MCAAHFAVVQAVSFATQLEILAALGALGSVACGVQPVAAGYAWVCRRARSRRQHRGRHALRGRARVRSRRGMRMITGEDSARWLVRLSVPRRGGVREWGAASDAFERGLAQQESPVVIAPQVEGETRRGRDYVRVAVVMAVAAADVGEALTLAWRGFCQAAASDLAGWDLDAGAAEVRPAPVREVCPPRMSYNTAYCTAPGRAGRRA